MTRLALALPLMGGALCAWGNSGWSTTYTLATNGELNAFVLPSCVLLCNSHKVTGLDVRDGRRLWTTVLDFQPSVPVESNGVIAISGSVIDKGVLGGLDLHTGKIKWRTPVRMDRGCRPIAIGARVLVASDNHRFLSVDSATGKLQGVYGSAEDLFKRDFPGPAAQFLDFGSAAADPVIFYNGLRVGLANSRRIQSAFLSQGVILINYRSESGVAALNPKLSTTADIWRGALSKVVGKDRVVQVLAVEDGKMLAVRLSKNGTEELVSFPLSSPNSAASQFRFSAPGDTRFWRTESSLFVLDDGRGALFQHGKRRLVETVPSGTGFALGKGGLLSYTKSMEGVQTTYKLHFLGF